jgi:hypothetical protein
MRDAEFEGVVDERDGDDLWVRLIDLVTDREYFAEMEVTVFPEADRPHLTPGALFTIGHHGKQVYAELRRRKPRTQVEIDRVNAEVEELWERLRPVMADESGSLAP